MRSLYKSADMEEDLSITLEPMGRLWHMRGHFGVVFHAQSKFEVTVHISWHGRNPCQGRKCLKKVKAQQVTRSKCHKVNSQQVTRSTGQRGLLENRVYSRTHFSTSLSPEEGPSCFLLERWFWGPTHPTFSDNVTLLLFFFWSLPWNLLLIWATVTIINKHLNILLTDKLLQTF